MKYRYIFFDLDGTLTDPKEGITKSVQYALKKAGIVEEDLSKLEPFIGPPLIDSFREFYGFTPEEAGKAVSDYREYFTKEGIFQNKLFDGVQEMLQGLKDMGCIVAVASSKPEPFVRQILEHFHIDGYFDQVCGATLEETRTKKHEVLEELFRRLGLSEENAPEILMVGDRKHDVEGAAVFGIDCLGVSLGYARQGELEIAGAVDIVDDMEGIVRFVAGR